MTAISIPTSWLRVLQQVAIVTKTSPVLSGGALRDLATGRTPKDLDIFVQHSVEAVWAVSEFFLSEGYEVYQEVDTEYVQNMDGIEYVLGFRKAGEVDLNFVFVAEDKACDAISIASRNDFGICQIAASVSGGSAHVYSTEAFKTDLANQTFTIVHQHDHARTLRRWERLSERYQGWRLVDPIDIFLEA